jgi:hypothetical protein
MSKAVEYRAYPEDREELLRRLEAAEQVCVLYGWIGSADDSPHDKACTQAWLDWHHAYGIDSSTPAWRSRIRELSAERDRVRTATLARIRGEGG